VKAESELRTGQLEGYRDSLGKCGVEETRLILLTRYPEEFRPEAERPDMEIRWFEVAGWLEDEIPVALAAGEVAGFVARQFLDFLGARGMTLTQVGKYMPEGLRAWGSLLNMLLEAAAACKVSSKILAGRESIGVKLDGPKYWLGVDYASPEKLWFGTLTRIDPEAFSKLGIGELSQDKGVPGGYRWWRSEELDSEPVHSFSRSKVGQKEWLEGFLHECLTMARSIETSEQPPIPEEPEGQ
jgi:hypothetical protein